MTARGLTGGDINRAHEVVLADGRRLFLKTNESSPPGCSPPRRGASAGSPKRARCGSRGGGGGGADDPQQFLALELVATGAPGGDFDEQLGQGLAALHRRGAPGFGLDHDNFIGSLPQGNAAATNWAEFYRTRRLEAQLRRAADQGRASSRMRQGSTDCSGARGALRPGGTAGAPARGSRGAATFFATMTARPASSIRPCYGGHREIDLAMMRLFGGFGARVFDAYREAWPLADGHQERVLLYQLYPLMVHVNLFGGSYVGSVEAALDGLC